MSDAETNLSQPLIAIAMGSDSDLPTMAAACEVCDRFGVPYSVHILSAHRTPERMATFAKIAHQQGYQVIIAGAGGAAHLPGMIASETPLPVIGVPVKTSTLSGVDSLYSIVQMPRGIPVATVAIGNAQNAGLLAIQILAAQRPALREKVLTFRSELAESVRKKDAVLTEVGYRAYLDRMSDLT